MKKLSLFAMMALAICVALFNSTNATGEMNTGMNNTGMNTSGNILSGNNNSGTVTSGTVTSGGSISGENLSGSTRSGEVMSGTTTGMNTTGMTTPTTSGTTNTGTTTTGETMRVLSGEGTTAMLMFASQEMAKRTQGGILLSDVLTAIEYLFKNGITKFGTKETFMDTKNIRRDEVATLFARARKLLIGTSTTITDMSMCMFTDLAKGHADLVDIVVESCKLGLFQGSKGMFMPTSQFTNAQALAVMVRMIEGMKSDETKGTHWASVYLTKAKMYGLTESLMANDMANLEKPITRGDVAKMIEGAARYLEAVKTLKPTAEQHVHYDTTKKLFMLKAN